MRVCHLDTCPVGVATQNPELRERFSGKAEYRRQLLRVHRRGGPRADLAAARLPHPRRGHRPTPRLLDTKPAGRPLEGAPASTSAPIFYVRRLARGRGCAPDHAQDHGLEKALDHELIAARRAGALEAGAPVRASSSPIRNVNRTVGTMLGREVTPQLRRRRAARRHRSTSRSPAPPASRFGAFVPRGITLRLEGDANDYVGKGLSGGS